MVEIGDHVIIINPWIFRGIIIISVFVGICIGLIISYFAVLHGLEIIGTAFKVENVNMTIQLNQSQIIEAINRTRTP